MKIFNFKKTVDSSLYLKILDYSLKLDSKMVFVCRNGLNSDLNELVHSHILKRERVSKWPGTISYSDKVQMYVIENKPVIIDKIKHLIPSLWDWKPAKYPEDLSFLRPNGIPWFVSITHENDAYMQLEDDEIEKAQHYFGTDILEFYEDVESVEKYL